MASVYDFCIGDFRFPFACGSCDEEKHCIAKEKHPDAGAPDNKAIEQWLSCGLLQQWNLNHEEALRCFERAGDECPYALLGVAMSSAPNYNKPIMYNSEVRRGQRAARKAVAVAEAYDARQGGKNRDVALMLSLCRAQAQRYDYGDLRGTEKEDGYNPTAPFPTDDMDRCNEQYADAMREIWRQYGPEPNLAALVGEALMQLRPWKLWGGGGMGGGGGGKGGKGGKGGGGGDGIEEEKGPSAAVVVVEENDEEAGNKLAMEVKDVLEAGLKLDPSHPGLCHYYIHLMEMSDTPEAALPQCEELRHRWPDMGHFLHMPSHIDIQVGRYKEAMEANLRACKADRRFLAARGHSTFYFLYYLHNEHFSAWAAMMLGRKSVALQAVENIENVLATPGCEARVHFLDRVPDRVEPIIGLRWSVLTRFGEWDRIITERMPSERFVEGDGPDIFLTSTAMAHWAKSLAHAIKGNVDKSDEHRRLFYEAKEKVPETRFLHNVPSQSALAVATAFLEGELGYRRLPGVTATRSLDEDDEKYKSNRKGSSCECDCSGANSYGHSNINSHSNKVDDDDDEEEEKMKERDSVWEQEEKVFNHLRRAVELEVRLPYDEPWGWPVPSAHALGALLLERGRVDEAERVFREDLRRYPDNIWALVGLRGALEKKKKMMKKKKKEKAEGGKGGQSEMDSGENNDDDDDDDDDNESVELERELKEVNANIDIAQAFTDVPIGATCLCALSLMKEAASSSSSSRAPSSASSSCSSSSSSRCCSSGCKPSL